MLKIFVFSVLSMFLFTSDSVSAKDCTYWHSRVGVQNIRYTGPKVDEKDPARIVEGIECLLQLEGVTDRGSISGATHNQVSQLLPHAPVEVTALHYVSYLFYERFDYANGVALHEKNRPDLLNSRETIQTAYGSYRKWFKKVKKLGITQARKRGLDPLLGSDICWY